MVNTLVNLILILIVCLLAVWGIYLMSVTIWNNILVDLLNMIPFVNISRVRLNL